MANARSGKLETKNRHGSSFKRYVGIFRRVARTCEGDREGNNELLTQELVLENSHMLRHIDANFAGAILYVGYDSTGKMITF